MFLTICKLMLPVLTLLFLGTLCRKKGILRPSTVSDIKGLISNFMMPVILFNALFAIDFSGNVVVLSALCFAIDAVALGFGFLTRRAAKAPGYYPFLLAGFEVGLLGYALFPLLFGQGSLGSLASLDLGGCLFFFCLYLPVLQGKRTSGTLGTLKTIVTAPTMIGCLSGLFLSATGLGSLLRASALWPVFGAVISLFTTAATPLILIIVGYGLAFKKEMMGAVLKTSLIRVCLMGALCALAALLLRALGISDSLTLYSLVFMCSLSSPYALALYATDESQNQYMNTQLSLYSVVTFAVFIVLSIVK